MLTVPAAKCAVARAVKNKDKAAELEARRALGAAVIANRITTVLADAPPLTNAQRSRLAELLKPVRR